MRVVTMLKFMLAGVLFLTGIYMTMLILPALETRFFPVYRGLEITKMEAVDASHTNIWVKFDKLRDGCDYVGLSWYKGSRVETFQKIQVNLNRAASDDSAKTRPVGIQFAGPWTLELPESQIETNSFAEVFHQCGGTPWVTRSLFYP